MYQLIIVETHSASIQLHNDVEVTGSAKLSDLLLLGMSHSKFFAGFHRLETYNPLLL